MNIPEEVILRMDFKRNKLFNFALKVQELFSMSVVLMLIWAIWALFNTELENIFIAKILLTIIFIGLGVIAPLIDLNQSHATNPHWTGHARFHLVYS